MDLSSYSPALVIVVIVGLALAPFVAVMVTSFTKIVVVLSLLRNALGLQQVPPNVVINGLAIVLSIYVMYPVILDTYGAITAHQQGKPVPASVQAQIDERQRAQEARVRAQAERAAERAQRAAAADAAAASGAPAPPVGDEPAPASPAAADALRAEAEAEAARTASEPGPLFRNVIAGDPAAGATAPAGTAPPATEIVAPPAPAPSPAPAFGGSEGAQLLAMFEAGKEPLRGFLIQHSKDAERSFFLRSAQSLLPPERRDALTVDDFIVVIPAFTVSELTAAFQIGFLIFLPFLIIDLVVANILLALGMMMMSPTTVSLPFKLLLFVLIDGWAKLVHGLVLTYTP